MNTGKEMKPVDETSDACMPRRRTLAQNLIATAEVLAGFALMGVALWGLDRWASAP